MAHSFQQFASDGTLQTVALTIKFFDQAEIQVLLNGVKLEPNTGLLKWNWIGPTTFKFNTPVPAGVLVRAERHTNSQVVRNRFTTGAQFLSSTLDDNFTQTLRLAQEAEERTGTEAPVLSVNGRRGDVLLVSSDITGALGYTPGGGIGAFNGRTGDIVLNSTDVTNALGFTPGSGSGGAANASVVTYTPLGVGSVARTAQEIFRETVSVADFGVLPGNADNTTGLAALVTYLNTFVGTGLLPNVVVPAGKYSYVTSPNWGVQNLTLRALGTVIFQHTGSGKAFIVDGGASGGGKYRVKILGQLQIQGNAATTHGIYIRAIHHSRFEVRPRDCVTVLEAIWCVCCEFDVQCTPVGHPAFNPRPTNGIVLGERNAGERTSACTFYNPIMEGIASYGINVQNAVINTFIGGTSESNGGGVFIGPNSSYNTFHNLDMEFNITADVLCQGYYNNFLGCMSSTTSTFGGANNYIQSGIYNTIVQSGVHNEYHKARYASAGGGFSESAQSIKLSVRNSQSNTMDPDYSDNPRVHTRYDAPTGYQMVMGRDDQISGGPATDFTFYKFGSGARIKFLVQGAMKFSMDGYGVGFNGINPIAKPYITGSIGNAANPAVADVVKQIVNCLRNYGLIDEAITN